jgi:hypothetical protein
MRREGVACMDAPRGRGLHGCRLMPLQSSKEHKVNGMTTRAVCSPSPQPSPIGRGGRLSRHYFMGIPQPTGGWTPFPISNLLLLLKFNKSDLAPND